jgi:hypothetical protein
MSITRLQITENDVVELTRAIGRWPAGTRGAVVSDHDAWKLIEVSDDQGVMLDLLDVEEGDLRLIAAYPSVPPVSSATSLRR